MLQSGSNIGGVERAPKTAHEVHAESPIGLTIIQVNNQLDSMDTALTILRERLGPVLVNAPTSNQKADGAEIKAHSPMGADLDRIYFKASYNTDLVYELIRMLTI